MAARCCSVTSSNRVDSPQVWRSHVVKPSHETIRLPITRVSSSFWTDTAEVPATGREWNNRPFPTSLDANKWLLSSEERSSDVDGEEASISLMFFSSLDRSSERSPSCLSSLEHFDCMRWNCTAPRKELCSQRFSKTSDCPTM